jgi:hypothetical protein
LKDGRTPSQSQMMMIAEKILKTTTWAEGRKEANNKLGGPLRFLFLFNHR